ncbi:MAG: glutamine--tRNA ligase, partial [Gammaproteobacteria bacterium]|nr:glutamine--tRNA ligase [Gammaproteobacteria bacterium]
YDPESRGGNTPDGRKVKGTIHWVSAAHAIDADIYLYDRLFNTPTPWTAVDVHSALNPESLAILKHCKLEPDLANATLDTRYQFERVGYFILDKTHSDTSEPVFNRIITLRDSWEKAR